MKKFPIRPTGIMIASSCNLACYGCDRYIEHDHPGFTRWKDAEQWMDIWSKRVYFPDMIDEQGTNRTGNISLIGGEPTMHPDLKEWIYGIAQYFPEPEKSLSTNGLKIPHLPDLYKWLQDTNIKLYVSEHSKDPAYQRMWKNTLKTIFAWDKWEKISEARTNLGLSHERFKSAAGVTLRIKYCDHINWVKSYQGYGPTMMPYEDNDPEKSFKAHKSMTCASLYEGKFYKCATIAMLRPQLEKYNLQDHPKWQRYYNFQGLDYDCSDEELQEFSENSDKAHWMCGKCPANPVEIGQPYADILKKPSYYKGL